MLVIDEDVGYRSCDDTLLNGCKLQSEESSEEYDEEYGEDGLDAINVNEDPPGVINLEDERQTNGGTDVPHQAFQLAPVRKRSRQVLQPYTL